MKRNLFKAQIINTSYIREDYKITCIIKWYNPVLDTEMKAKGVAKCHPNDVLSLKHGSHIAESRAKVQIFKRMKEDCYNVMTIIAGKHFGLEEQELQHINGLVHYDGYESM